MKIFWTKKALEQHSTLEEYLLEKWSKTALDKYYSKLESKLLLLKDFPEAGVLINDFYRRITITAQTSLVYKIIGKDQIIIMMVWDNRKKPIW